jgi:hypothetical protein
MYRLMVLMALLITTAESFAQEVQDEEPHGFQKNKLFTGGSISLGLSNNSFQAGANPVFGYSLASWVDAGVVANYNYASFRDVYFIDDKIRSSTYGGGAFVKLYPLRFLFAHAQFEHNFIKEKYIPGNGNTNETNNVEANSLLLGLGLATERYAGDGRPFFYFSVLFDVLDQEFSPYTRSGRSFSPILRAGIQVPLFQGRGRF